MSGKKRSWWPLVVPLVVAPMAAHGAPDKCSKVNAVSGDLTVAEASIVNGARIPTVVILNGSNSNPKNNCTCTWTQLTGPAVQLGNPGSCTTTFTAPNVGPSGQNLDFRLSVKSTEAGCETLPAATKDITVNVANVNRPPLASVSAPASVYEGAIVTLDGSASSDPDGDLLDFAWSQTGGTPVTLTTDSTGKIATFTAPPEKYPGGETLKFQLKVSDGNLSNSTPEIRISVASVNEAPVAAISCPTAINEAAPVTLSGNASFDPDAGPLAFEWSQDHGGPVANLEDVLLGASAITFKAPILTSPEYDTIKFGVTVTDNGNLSSSAHCDIKVVDVTPPVISGIGDIVKEATSSSGAAVTFAPVAHDTFYGDVPVTCDADTGSIFALGTRTVACEASDKATVPNTAHATFKVTVQDTTPPVVTVPSDLQAEATGPSGAVVTFSPSALDVVDGSVTPSCSPPSGAGFALGAAKVTCSAADNAGNVGSSSFTVTVADTTPPAVSVPAELRAEATGPSGAMVTFSASALDVADGSITPSCSPASGTSFALGATKVTCSAADKAGNIGSSSFAVTVADTTPPAVSVPAELKGEATGPSGALLTFSASALDVVDGSVTPSCSPASGTSFALGATKVTCSAADKAGNIGSSSFAVTVADTTPPAVTVPSELKAEATGPSGARVTFSASALDVVDGSIAPSCSPASGTSFALGTTSVTCSAADKTGNKGSSSFAVTVADKTPPVLSSPATVTVYATGLLTPVTLDNPAATDLVDGVVPAVSDAPAAGFPVGATTVTWTAKDKAGNVGTASSTVTVKPWTLSGFYSPIDMNGVVNTVKGGSTVPMKFQVFAGTNELTTTSSISGIKAVPVDCSMMAAIEDAVPVTDLVSGGTSLRYDTTGRQFIYNWQTPKLPGTCYVVTATTVDKSTIKASFKLR